MGSGDFPAETEIIVFRELSESRSRSGITPFLDALPALTSQQYSAGLVVPAVELMNGLGIVSEEADRRVKSSIEAVHNHVRTERQKHQRWTQHVEYHHYEDRDQPAAPPGLPVPMFELWRDVVHPLQSTDAPCYRTTEFARGPAHQGADSTAGDLQPHLLREWHEKTNKNSAKRLSRKVYKLSFSA